MSNYFTDAVNAYCLVMLMFLSSVIGAYQHRTAEAENLIAVRKSYGLPYLMQYVR
jgi:hypothetical protein